MKVARPVSAFVAIALASAAPAQFGSFLRSITPPSSSASDSSSNGGGDTHSCDQTSKHSAGASIFGKMVGDATTHVLGRSGVSWFVPIPEVAGVLSTAIACRLDAGEQKQAAGATQKAVREGAVGSSASWTSESRQNVSGTSTVTARNEAPDGTTCVQVTDVVIVNGEETTVPKKMCRAPGASGFTIAQA